MLDSLDGDAKELRVFSTFLSGDDACEEDEEDDHGVLSLPAVDDLRAALSEDAFGCHQHPTTPGEEQCGDSADNFVQLVLGQAGGAEEDGGEEPGNRSPRLDHDILMYENEALRGTMRGQESPLFDGCESVAEEGEVEVEVEEEGRINLTDLDIQALEEMLSKEMQLPSVPPQVTVTTRATMGLHNQHHANSYNNTSGLVWEAFMEEDAEQPQSTSTGGAMLPLIELFVKSPRAAAGGSRAASPCTAMEHDEEAEDCTLMKSLFEGRNFWLAEETEERISSKKRQPYVCNFLFLCWLCE